MPVQASVRFTCCGKPAAKPISESVGAAAWAYPAAAVAPARHTHAIFHQLFRMACGCGDLVVICHQLHRRQTRVNSPTSDSEGAFEATNFYVPRAL